VYRAALACHGEAHPVAGVRIEYRVTDAQDRGFGQVSRRPEQTCRGSFEVGENGGHREPRVAQ